MLPDLAFWGLAFGVFNDDKDSIRHFLKIHSSNSYNTNCLRLIFLYFNVQCETILPWIYRGFD